MTTKEAVDHLTNELKKDEGYFYSWQSNIAMAFVDEYENKHKYAGVHTIANEAAKNFLNMLIKQCEPENVE